jgi:hypothetical protein
VYAPGLQRRIPVEVEQVEGQLDRDLVEIDEGGSPAASRSVNGPTTSSLSPRTTTSTNSFAAVCSGRSVGCTPPQTIGTSGRSARTLAANSSA